MTLTRREFVVTSTLAAAGSLLHELPLFGQQPPPTTPKFDPVKGSVGMFSARGGTIGYYITPDAVVVIDSQFPDTAKMLLDGLKQRTQRQIDALVNTHHHADHTGGNAVLKPAVKRIVAHARVPDLQKAQAAATPNAPEQAFPDTTFADRWEMPLAAGDKLVARHYGPGHTGGDIVIHFQKDDVVHMGDLMFNRRHPFVDRAAGASVRNWITLLEKVSSEFKNSTYIFGHAKDGLPVVGKASDLLVFRDYFTAALDHVRKGISAGRSKDEIVKLAALPKFEDYMEAPPRLTLGGVLGVAYDELTAKS
jgi:glyoxylase-like metal-dependent hydrolase (beta-lactamase superfamily II)